jgi:HD superfamily phosphohydrolase YqeK
MSIKQGDINHEISRSLMTKKYKRTDKAIIKAKQLHTLGSTIKHNS